MSSTTFVPQHVFLEITIECNLRCVQCDIYKLTNPAAEMSLEDRLAVVRHLGEWDKSIRVVLAGGEPFTRRPMLYSVAQACKEAGVYATISTNGTLVTEEDARRLPESGIRCVVVSIDSHERAVHDEIRGVRGTFDRAIRTIERLVSARDRAKTDFTVLTSTIIGRHNLGYVREMVGYLEGLGVDTTLFQPLQPVFARQVEERWWSSAPLFPNDTALVENGIDELIALKRMGRRMFQTVEQFEDMRSYFRRPNRLVLGQCDSMNKHLMVDMFGDVRLCFNMERIGLKPIGNVRETSLRDLWTALQAEKVRSSMRCCAEGCGSMICHAR
jgi:MoaA/NifB/PqqE/SkfB family radical SAM enzyme